MGSVSKALLALCLAWNVGAFARQPTPFLPDPQLTPGDVFDVTIEDICTPGFSKKVRAVTKALRDQALKRYGILSPQPSEYQLDHLIPRARWFEFHKEPVATAKQYVAVERAG